MGDWEETTKQEDWSFSFFLNGIKKLWQLMEGNKNGIFIVIGWMILTSTLELTVPFLLKLIFDELPGMLAAKKISSCIIWLVAAMFLVKILSLYIYHFIKEIRFLKIIIGLENFWPVMAQEKLLALSLGYHEKENTGKKIAKINKGCEKLIDILSSLYWSFLPHLLYLLINLVVILVMDWKIGLMFLLPFIPAAMINLMAYKRLGPGWEQWEEKKEISTGIFCQSLINVQTVQNYVQEEKEKSDLASVRKEMETLDNSVNKQLQNYFFAIGLILHASFILTIAASIYFAYRGQSAVGTIVYLIATGSVTIQSLWELVHVYMRIMKNLVAVVRMKELIDEKVDIKSCEAAVIPENFRGNFELKDATFFYQDKNRPVLENLNLGINPNQMVALVSKSGEGKTTITRLICRMHDVSDGAILLDGQDIRNLDLFWYRRLFAVVQQDVDIFDASLRDNIAYSCPKAPEWQILKAARAAHLEEILTDKEKFPDGINTQVGERGVRLSGGQRQRVGIARAYLALLNGSRVLILDEATSSLDSEAEKAIQKMIDEIKKEMSISIIAIAHRLSTIQKSDMIFVVDNGKVIEQGNHEKLMEKNGLYSRLVELQKLGDLRE